MLIMSVNINKWKTIAIFLIIVTTICAIMILNSNMPATDVLSNVSNKNMAIKSTDDCVKYFLTYGWEVDNKPIEVVDVTIPKVFDDVYKNYNVLQKQAGLDLEKYKGVKAKRYTFRVTNHLMSDKEEVRGNIIVYNSTVIAGDICSVKLDGFMHALNGKYEPKQ